MQPVFDEVTRQLESQGLILKRGTLVDATIIQFARTPPPKDDSGERRGTSDPDATWAVKHDKPIAHGFKAHIAIDQGGELIRAATATMGSRHDFTKIAAGAAGLLPRLSLSLPTGMSAVAYAEITTSGWCATPSSSVVGRGAQS